MSAEKSYRLRCNGSNCLDWITFRVDTVAEARRLARKNHQWVSRHGRDYCPRHRP